MRPILLLALIGLAPASLARSEEAVLLNPGRYEVRVRLDLPNIEGAAASTLRFDGAKHVRKIARIVTSISHDARAK